MSIIFYVAFAIYVANIQTSFRPMVRYAVYEDSVYLTRNINTNRVIGLTGNENRLLMDKVDLYNQAGVSALDCFIGINPNQNSLLRWQIIDGKYHCVRYRFHRIAREGLIFSVPIVAIELISAITKNATNDQNQYHWKYRKFVENGPDFNPGQLNRRTEQSIVSNVYFDFWSRGGKEYELYTTEPHNQNLLVRIDYHEERVPLPEAARNPEFLWETVNTWKFDWTGPFYVTATGDERFFVTDAGRVYTPPKDAKPGALLKELWKGAPVDVLIHDSDHKKWYAFTKDQYFEVADPIKPKPHALTIRRSWFAEPALETAAKCGRVIRGLPEPK